jgi:hypothetical protein
MTCSGQFEEQWPRVKQQPKVDRRTRANGRRASTSSPTCALSLSQLTARTARAGSRWHRPSCFPSATCREISRHLSEGHVCEKKGVKKPVNPKNHATADNGRRPLLLCERRPPDLLCVQRPVCRHTHAPQESRLSSARAGREKSYILRALPSIFEQLPHGRLAPGRRLLTWKDAGAASLCMDRAAWSRWPRIGWRAARSPSSHLWVASGTMDRVRKLKQAAGHSPASCSSCLLLQARVERRRLE